MTCCSYLGFAILDEVCHSVLHPPPPIFFCVCKKSSIALANFFSKFASFILPQQSKLTSTKFCESHEWHRQIMFFGLDFYWSICSSCVRPSRELFQSSRFPSIQQQISRGHYPPLPHPSILPLPSLYSFQLCGICWSLRNSKNSHLVFYSFTLSVCSILVHEVSGVGF